MQKIKKLRQFALLLTMYGALLIFLATTNPRNTASVVLIMPVAWLFLTLVLTVFWAASYVAAHVTEQSRYRPLTRALLIAGVPSGLLLLQSINQLTPKDILLIGIFGGLALVYSKRFQLQRKRDSPE